MRSHPDKTSDSMQRGWKPTAHATVVAVATLLSACGGGESDGTATAQSQAGAATTAASADQTSEVTVQADSKQVARLGEFQSVDGHLAKSSKVLRGVGTVTMTAKVPRAGRYELSVWWPQGLTDAGQIDIEVAQSSGQAGAVRKDQRVNGGEWISIGVYDIASAGDAAVRFNSQSGGAIYVDAVRLRELGRNESDLPAIATEQLPIGLKGEAYVADLATAGGRAPLSFSVSEGALPPGLSLDKATGVITGQPTARGSFDVGIAVRDAQGRTVARSFSVVIEASASRASEAKGQPPASGRKSAQSLGAAGSASAPPDLTNILTTVANMPEGEWQKVNLNRFADVWAPADLRPLFGSGNPEPSRIILAWSSFAWDPNRAALILYGGGHANYRGNDVYRWFASTQRWERAALPSQMVQTPQGQWNAIDGADKAPASAHTYDNTIFLPILDRMLVLGGAADPNGSHYLTPASATTTRVTGPYLFDPARAHPDKVGGSTGSHVKRVAPYPEVVGGNMWSNRESWLNASTTSKPPVESFVNGCTGYAMENGRDVVYARTANRLYRYEIGDLSNPATDTWRQVGTYWFGGSGGKSTCAYDPDRKIFLSTYQQNRLIYWPLNTLSPNTRDTLVTPTDPTGEFATLVASGAVKLSDCAIDFDPIRRDFKLWCADARVWSIKPPATMGAAGWVVEKQTPPTGAAPTEGVALGILGKWKYIPNLDVFMGLADSVQGNIWIYKPRGWVNPGSGTPSGNVAPSVSLGSPAPGASFTVGTSIALSAAASDSDGEVVRVEFFANGTKIGESTTGPGYGIVWPDAAPGTYALTAVATDNGGASRTSGTVSITVNAVVSNQPPLVALTQPVAGAVFTVGNPVTLAATASDPDGTVASVEFFAGSTSLGTVSSAPYTLTWTTAPLGTSSITAVARDNAGAVTSTAANAITVQAVGTGGTATLQRGSAVPSQVWDTYLSSYHKTLNFGTTVKLQDQFALYPTLLRFAIFHSEGGPVPNGAQITSAVLSFYKYSSYDMQYGLHRVLKEWSETSATWNQRLPGVPWTVAGAAGAGTDYAATADGTASTSFNPGWVTFNVTAGVQQMSQNALDPNLGWVLRGVSGYASALKLFHASESADPSLRPKLVISWQ
ncbi:Ig-like domain-containing protein [Pseudaquabacterium pictum]|uniref:Uncharacterized protein n=1 Tax=Pseudaquabacterium pictum TaxID=2315236 RepID=A0A480ASL6_9BURK|nr:Ig-like domain-containing protein [Rubrivivax pictus]GCL64403.1 hypothetical protein AQPW35_34840 [Rubrivivax pictus]